MFEERLNTMTQIILSGCTGHMGKTIRDCVSQREGCEIAAGFGIGEHDCPFPVYANPSDCKEQGDVIIDFSNPALLTSLLCFAKENKLPVVLCTTGFSKEQIAEIHEASKEIPVFFSANMSLGINLLVELAKKAAKILSPTFDIEIIERHHNQKVDAPSGTALMLADAINETLDGADHYVYDRHSVRQKREKHEIGIHSIRGGTIVGEHEVLFAGNNEMLSLTHTATSKAVFAEGAINAAVFLTNRTPGLYNMKDMMEE